MSVQPGSLALRVSFDLPEFVFSEGILEPMHFQIGEQDEVWEGLTALCFMSQGIFEVHADVRTGTTGAVVGQSTLTVDVQERES